MSVKTNNTIPANTTVGARQLTNQFRNISLSREALDYLSSIGGTFRMEISGETGVVSHNIVDRNGNFLSTTREFEQLANYKSFIMKKKDELSISADEDKKVATYHNLKSAYEAAHGIGSCPARMLEANSSKFGQIKKSIEVIEKHLRVIETLPAGDYRTYLIEKGSVLKRIYIKGLVETMGPTKFEQSTHDEWILKCCVPKYIENKFIDPNFTKDVKTDASPLLFPRGNFLKSVSLQTREINSDSFMNANRTIHQNSHSIIQLARSEPFKHWFIPRGSELESELDIQWEKFQWPMLAPGGVEEFLAPRLNRVNVKSFTPILAPKLKPGQKGFRPETPFQKEVRELKNLLHKLLSVMLDFYHLLPRVDDPLQDFWMQFFVTTADWVISPEKTIYDWINESENRDHVIGAIINNEMNIMRRRMIDIIGMQLNIPSNSARMHNLRTILAGTGPNNTTTNYPDNPPLANALRTFPEYSMHDMENTARLTDPVRTEVSIFRGKATEELLASEKTRAIVAKKKLDKQAIRFLRGITDRALKESIEKWIRENFRSKKMQNLAAEYAAMAIEDENLGYDESQDEESSSTEEDNEED